MGLNATQMHIFIFSLEMMSPATSRGRQIAETCSFWVMFSSNFSIMVKLILKKLTVVETVIQGFHFLFCNQLDIFAP